MDQQPESKKDSTQKKPYVKPEAKVIRLDDEEGLLEFCRGKPFDVKQLKEVIHQMLHSNDETVKDK